MSITTLIFIALFVWMIWMHTRPAVAEAAGAMAPIRVPAVSEDDR